MVKMISRTLIDAPQDQCFWVHNGPVLRNLRELRDALASEAVNDEQFKYHVGRGKKNDFASWVSGILHDESCARALMRTRTRKTALRVVNECLERYR
jgi:hypothetical protein